ncbi:acetyl-CoA C-acyltransferase [Fusibacter paucivorans]|uniref:acetyl-CoA C-acyltransferase n=1 Tax=Fusibacter paucivorans TaxID=76009 RepID=A0ABS5PK20_9FIRM|nr:acetyl-CoA C-acyltransferase [Fusibacter paucivorans]MBS7525348.1 acetyl-CoA C-acyltransferase [Fusibacter paucivorans]
MREAVIVAMGRSPIGKAPKGSLSKTRPESIGAQVLKGVVAKLPALNLKEIDDVIVGCAFPEGEQGVNLARIISLKAGLPDDVPAQTVNRFCSSGLQTIATAANSIMAGQADCIIAGGIESMSAVPIGGNMYHPDPALITSNPSAYISMGLTAENVADAYGVTRAEQDAFAAESHRRALEAIAAGKFDEEIIAIDAERMSVDGNGKPVVETFQFKMDEGARKGVTAESLGKLRTVFKMGGTVTAGNASQMSDGAAFVMLMSREKAEALGIKPIAAFRSYAVAGVDPALMGIGPIKAIPKALKIASLAIDDLELIELNEAFASQSLACIQTLALDRAIVNVNGGAIALGHPLGCTGAYLTIKLLSEMKRGSQQYGLVSMCIGGGMGAAAVFEMIRE